MILGAFVSGVEVQGRNYSGGPFDFASAFSVMTGIAVVFGYALLGATWIIMKTKSITQDWAKKISSYVLFYVGLFMVLVSYVVPLIDIRIEQFWFTFPNFFYLLPIPVITALLFFILWRNIQKGKKDFMPFVLTIGIFFMGYLGLGISIYPWIIPFKYTLWDAAASGPGQSLLLVGIIPLLPIILLYTSYNYYIFRGKSEAYENEY